ncbi:MAG: amidase family protein [Pseudomonadota bacterium]
MDTSLSAVEIGRRIDNGHLDPVDVTMAYLDAIASSADTPSIYTALTKDRALAEAEAARARQKVGSRRSPLDGVPISWKDLFDSAGTATEAGSALLRGRVPDHDALLLARASSAGLVCLGKTHMSELAFSGLGLNPITETPPNIHDPRLVPGGSSSGAAASVAFGLASAAIGSDTGGSIRIPSAWNDLVGFKPRHGVLPMAGTVPLCPRFDTAGPLCRSIEDAKAIFDILNGQIDHNAEKIEASALSLAVLRSPALQEMDDDVSLAFETVLGRLGRAGVTLTDVEHRETSSALELSGVLFTTEAYGTWGDRIETNPEKMFAEIRDRFRSGAQYSGAEYVKAWQALERYRASFERTFSAFDGVILPTSPITPPEKERLLTDAEYYKRSNLLALRNTRVGNLMGVSGISLPTATPSVGFMILDPLGADHRLFSVSTAIEGVLKD